MVEIQNNTQLIADGAHLPVPWKLDREFIDTQAVLDKAAVLTSIGMAKVDMTVTPEARREAISALNNELNEAEFRHKAAIGSATREEYEKKMHDHGYEPYKKPIEGKLSGELPKEINAPQIASNTVSFGELVAGIKKVDGITHGNDAHPAPGPTPVPAPSAKGVGGIV